jgi:4-diphosphocytidyl-2-C-methyl-D-erythritol kinase
MICFPHAKINIGLHITGKRSDGFHNIQSIFYPIPLCDGLEIVEARETGIEITGREIPGNSSENLALKAYRLLQDDFKLPPVRIFLHKMIPAGAGLGGGSSDAAFMLRLLNEKFQLAIPQKKLHGYAFKLGSDCPFFLRTAACSNHVGRGDPLLAAGRGDVLKKISLDLSGFHLVVIFPNIHVDTAFAYSIVKPPSERHRKQRISLREIIHKYPISKWKNRIVNDFEEPVCKHYPLIAEVKNELYKIGAVYASMTGSGSALYAFFRKEVKLKGMFRDFFAWQAKL